MKPNSISKNLSYSVDIKKGDSRIHYGSSLILGPTFDIKKYLESVEYLEKTGRKQKFYFPPITDRKNFKNKKNFLSTMGNENSLIHKTKSLHMKKKAFDESSIFNNNKYSTISKKFKFSSAFNTINDYNSLSNEKTKASKTSRNICETETDSRTLDLRDYKKNDKDNNSDSEKDENLNILKKIKSIKKEIDTCHKDKSIKNILNQKIVYDPNNLDCVFKPIRIIHDYDDFKKKDLNNNKGDIATFILNNNEISKNNLLLKLIDKQKRYFNKSIAQRIKTIDYNKNKIDVDEINFECFTTNQKQANKRIENKLNDLLVKTRRLLIEERRFLTEIRIKEDEKQKYLEQIDELRVIAQFVNKVLGNSPELINLLSIKIIPEYSSEKLPNYEKITKEVCERFNFLLYEENEIGKDNISKSNKSNSKSSSKINNKIINTELSPRDEKLYKEFISLNDCELFYNEFYKMEKDIINDVRKKEKLNIEFEGMKKEEISQCIDIHKRIEHLENELNSIKYLYEREKKQYNDLYKFNKIRNADLDDIVYDLYYEVMGIFNKLKKGEGRPNSKKDLVGVNYALKEIMNIIVDCENKFEYYTQILESYEKSNKYLFGRICNHLRNSRKEMKVNMLKKILAKDEKEKSGQKKEEKIIFIRRKAEPPFQPTKKKKKIKLDPELVKQLEDEELITYK